jgi:hypothetical protein
VCIIFIELCASVHCTLALMYIILFLSFSQAILPKMLHKTEVKYHIHIQSTKKL